MKPWLAIASIACFSVIAACGPDGEGPSPNGPNPPGGQTKLPERDGIPSDNNADRLLYYMSTQEGAAGLYAYRPSTPGTSPVLVDGEISLVAPFHHAVHGGTIETDGSVSDFHVAGVAYVSERLGVPDETLPTPTPEYLHIASTNPTDFQVNPPRVSNTSTSSVTLTALSMLFSFTLNDLAQSTLLVANFDRPFRYDFDMGPDEPALALPKGKTLFSMLGEGSDAHEHWLYLNEDGSLEFYSRDFSSSAPPIDEDTDAALPALSRQSFAVTYLNEAELLFVAALKSDEGNEEFQGTLYRITRPTSGHPGGTAKKLLNADGEPLLFGMGFMAPGLGAPSGEMSYVRDNAMFFANGPSMFDPVGTTAYRIDADSWSTFDHLKAIGRENADMTERIIYSNLTPVVIPVLGHGTFWAPGGNPELIEPTAADGQSWKRTELDAPRPKSTTIQSSSNGWIYYQGDNTAVAYHVPTNETVRISLGEWLGASSNGRSPDISGVTHFELAEVFLKLPDGRVAALEASDPKKGMVILGTLPSTAKKLALFSGGRGPHRLMRLEHEDESVEVLYVDTRTKGSLLHLMSAPAKEWEFVYSVIMGEEIKMKVKPDRTRPVELF